MPIFGIFYLSKHPGKNRQILHCKTQRDVYVRVEEVRCTTYEDAMDLVNLYEDETLMNVHILHPE